MPAPRKYAAEHRQRAVRLVAEARKEDLDLSLNAVVLRIVQRVRVNPDKLGRWCNRAAINTGERPVTTANAAARITQLEAENGEVKNVNEICWRLPRFCAGARSAIAVVVQFIDNHRDRFGVEPTCRVSTEQAVSIILSDYYAIRPDRSQR